MKINVASNGRLTLDTAIINTTTKEIVWKSATALAIHYAVLITVSFLPFSYNPTYQRITGTWVDHFLQWDGIWYSLIGKYGYHLPQQAQVILSHLGNHLPITPIKATGFFPLIPLLVHAIGTIGTLVLTNLLFVASVFLYATWLKKHDLSVEWGVLLFALNPAAMFQSLVYPEPYLVFFTLCVMWLTETKTRWWWLSAFLGYLSSLTAGLGAVIGIFVISFFQRKEWARGLVYAVAVAMGWVTFAVILVSQNIPALAFLKAQQLWGRVWKFPLEAWFDQFGQPMFIGHWDQIFVAIYIGLFIAFLIKWFRKRHLPLSSFSWGAIYATFCLSTYWVPFPLIGTLRFISVTIPLYAFITKASAMWKQWLAYIVLVAFMLAFTLGSLFISHGAIYQ